jgi:Fe-Mn family superoxide dismutase
MYAAVQFVLARHSHRNSPVPPYFLQRRMRVLTVDAAYITKTCVLIRHTPLESYELEEVVRSPVAQQNDVLFHASTQAWNHAFFWRSMHPGGGSEPAGRSLRRSQPPSELSGLQIVATTNAENPAHYETGAAIDARCVGARLLSRLSTSPHDYIAAFLGHLINWDSANRNLVQHLAAPALRSADRPVRARAQA